MNSNYVIIGQDPQSKDFFFHERVDNNGKPGQIIKMGDGKGDVEGLVNSYIEEGFDPSKIIINGQPATDVFQKSDDKKTKEKFAAPDNKTEAPEITRFQAMTLRLTDEQIDAINNTGKLPNQLKVVQNNFGNFIIVYDFGKITQGTKEVPAGYEIKRNVIGQAIIVPKGTEGLLIADKKSA